MGCFRAPRVPCSSSLLSEVSKRGWRSERVGARWIRAFFLHPFSYYPSMSKTTKSGGQLCWIWGAVGCQPPPNQPLFELESVSVHPVHGNPRTGLLRTFWKPDRVLRSPLRGLCVQGVLSCPTRRAFQCTLYTETPERAF